MANVQVTLFHGEKTKKQEQHDFPRYHIVTGTFRSSFITTYRKKKPSMETH